MLYSSFWIVSDSILTFRVGRDGIWGTGREWGEELGMGREGLGLSREGDMDREGDLGWEGLGVDREGDKGWKRWGLVGYGY
ncbi:hypothetical protein TorRG33x02_041240 [Trema orientale]|uniref:Uncharacterized protein n=1 Tax=Trema orientale TaxID=63057 RepID=A0A2P5FQD4_TREOI|nr:hypothetical protein TorRG33x02_041240 [Trema orientale]